MARVGCAAGEGESKLEDQATQTDDEAEDDTPIKPRRPTNFKNGKILFCFIIYDKLAREGKNTAYIRVYFYCKGICSGKVNL